ncbi:hypothetical protein A0H81_11777 [Grifola frondosa]|uniref:Uncharacterized protein n=1 Tax=Grifola frondosa TaxID=5627 RepID=A0A1C7LTN9_GRIFR|nr:hypothetical protein A0H81_11777 [Grifola frondosa]
MDAPSCAMASPDFRTLTTVIRPCIFEWTGRCPANDASNTRIVFRYHSLVAKRSGVLPFHTLRILAFLRSTAVHTFADKYTPCP